MQRIILLLFLLLPAVRTPAQFWMQFAGSASIDEALDVASDPAGNIYSTGYFTGNAAFDAFNVSSAGLDDIFVYKMNTAGVAQWVKRAGGTGSDKGLGVDANNSSVVVTGYFSGTAQFDVQSVISSGQQDIFIAKYNAAGALQWVVQAGGTGYDAGNGITQDGAGNVIVTGEFTGSCTFGTVTLTSASGSIDVFTAKYNSSGVLLWVEQGSGPQTDRGLDVETDATGCVYVSGTFSDTITFDMTHNNAFNNALFLIKYNPSGQEIWFRWMGSSSTATHGGMDVSDEDVGMAGSLTGTLYFFGGVGFPNLPTAQPYNLFLCRYDTAGNYQWSHADGSVSEVDVGGFAFQSTGDQVLAGSFKCRFTDFSAQYGSGTFCSVGFWDSWVAAYDNTGARTWARNFGSSRNDQATGLCMQLNTRPVVSGSFEDRIVATNNPGNFLGYNTSTISQGGAYCSDNEYNRHVSFMSAGNRDIYINNNIDLSREPFDYFYRTGFSCLRDTNDICISNTFTHNLNCQDTVSACQPTQLFSNTNTYVNRGPDWSYLWAGGSTANQITASVSGTYSVTATSLDGCFLETDSVYFDLRPFPPVPAITDNKGVNVSSTAPLDVEVCFPDSVELLCTNVGSDTVAWSGPFPVTFPVGQNPVTVTVSGDYTCLITNSAGCSRSTLIHVEIFPPLQTILPRLICLEDTIDRNDTIEICENVPFSIFPYDSITNPLASQDSCVHELTWVIWDTTGLLNDLAFSTLTLCPIVTNTFVPLNPGSFDFTFTAAFIRETACDSDTVFISMPLHVIVNPEPTLGNFPTSITASDTMICPGTPVSLVAGGGGTQQWLDSNGTFLSGDDTLLVYTAGLYTLQSDSVLSDPVTGCTASLTSYKNIRIYSHPQPLLIMVPSDGIACPNDSVQLICTGVTGGSYSWQGPSGAIPDPDSIIYATAAGAYSCVVVVAPGCTLVTNTLNVLPYNNPILLAFPTPGLCDNNPIQLTAVANQGSNINWLPPLSGSSAVQTVTDTGTYRCDVTSCGILTQLSYYVRRDTAFAFITSNGSPQFCAGDSVQLTANTGMQRYLWLPSGDTTLVTWVSQGGTDTLITTSLYGCKDTATILVQEVPNLLQPPSVTDTVVCSGEPVTLFATGTDTIYWANTPNYADTFYSGTSFFIPVVSTPVTYYLYTHSGLCKSGFDTSNVLLNPCNDILLPNVITPDGDQLNDFFPGDHGDYVFDLKIFNRWGNLVFEATDATAGWGGETQDGQAVPDGTYYYVLDVTFRDETHQEFKGAVMVMKGK